MSGGPASVPAYSCRFCILGTCCYEEMRNPGLHAELACPRLTELMREWDGFLDRAEAFSLSEEQAAAIWERRRHACLTSAQFCPLAPRLPTEAATVPNGAEHGCGRLYGNACLLAMPPCPGPCARYAESSCSLP